MHPNGASHMTHPNNTAEKNAHVQLVFLALEPGEEAVDAGEIGFVIALDDGVALLGGELAKRHVQGNAAGAGEALQVLPKLAITGLGPGWTTPSLMDLPRSGMTRSISKSMVLPKPWQRGQAP